MNEKKKIQIIMYIEPNMDGREVRARGCLNGLSKSFKLLTNSVASINYIS